MKAINLPFFKNELKTLSKDLYLEHGWDLPDGHKENGWKNPLNFTLAEWQQARRLGLDPREIKQLFREAWQRSDNAASFASALEQSGYFLAQGERRGFVALDVKGEVFSVSRMTGAKTRDLEARLGSPEKLPTVEQRKASIDVRMAEGLRDRLGELREGHREQLRPLDQERRRMVEAQREERARLRAAQEQRWRRENRERQARVRKGIRGVFDILVGRAAIIRWDNDREAFAGHLRDTAQRERLFFEQMREREALQKRIAALRRQQREEVMTAARHVQGLVRPAPRTPPEPVPAQARARPRRRGKDFDFEL